MQVELQQAKRRGLREILPEGLNCFPRERNSERDDVEVEGGGMNPASTHCP